MAELLRIALVYPELLGTYGDRGNAEVLAWHAVRHGLAARLVEVPASEPVPAGLDAYLLGGGEDAAQAVAARLLRSPAGDGLRRAVDDGRAVLAVCGAFQLLGRTYTDGGGRGPGGRRGGLVPGHFPARPVAGPNPPLGRLPPGPGAPPPRPARRAAPA